MGAILAENKVHQLYWSATSKPTITTTNTNEASGFEFVNMFDNNAHTSYMLATGTQGVTIIDFGSDTFEFNGFAVYGHNLTNTQGIKIEHSDDNASYTILTDSAVYPANGEIKPKTDLGQAFGLYLKGSTFTKRYLRITTVGWTTSSFISNLSIGSWTDGINIQTGYTPPSFTLHESTIKRNNEGNFMSSDVRKIPQKLNISLINLTQSDLDATGTSTTETSFSTESTFINYLGFFLSRFPFFVMHDTGSGTNSEISDTRNQIYFCTADKTIKQPVFQTPTTFSWTINAIGYIS